MDLSSASARIAVWAVVGGVAGLVLGFLLLGLGVVDNPYWVVSDGIFVGAVLAPVQGARGRGR